MAPTRGTNAIFLLDEFDFSGDTSEMTFTSTVDSLEHSDLSSTAKEFLPTVASCALEISGYYDVAAGAATEGKIEKELYDRLGTATAAYAFGIFGTSATGCPSYVIDSTWGDNLSIQTPSTGLIAVNGSFGNTATYRGLRVFTGTISGTGGQTGIDFSSAGSNGGKGWLHISAITGSASSATITVESDDNAEFSSAATEGTFTFSAVGLQTVSLSGTVDQYIRLNCTSLGGATDFTVVGVVAVSGVTY